MECDLQRFIRNHAECKTGATVQNQAEAVLARPRSAPLGMILERLPDTVPEVAEFGKPDADTDAAAVASRPCMINGSQALRAASNFQLSYGLSPPNSGFQMPME
ncbi:hypothetical protein B0H17DRAFT_1147632 [Mycena rosella]|uniref:Uncharacterized protein n=1 Tax=Mycena rosella TaxID=1033263 RepID=A0AAD7G360_MYCRO|nr:hypothetical protein B0H17DRAFT_1147632 [Mycena rosella]